MTLAPGARLGPYEIVAAIGAGGMGEVYKARDPRIGRDVAIMVLPALVSRDPDRLRRFEQEARAAGALNHPNILTIHDIGVHDGVPYVVSELLEGETLRERLGEGALPRRKTIEYASEVARGLAAAHEKGIVHRDLKPENLFLTTDGRVKILDFGLAKLTVAEAASQPGSMAPTEVVETQPGVVLGTAGYMSPEQVRGKPADSRADIFSLGCILYEMLSGQRVFQKETTAETLTAILKEDPPPIEPPAIDRLLRRCLEKSPGERFQSARDLGFALEAVGGASVSSTVLEPAAVPRGSRRRVLAGALAAVLLAAVSFSAAWWMRKPAPAAKPPVIRRVTADAGLATDPAVSPSGALLAYASDRAGNLDIWVQPLPSGEPVRVTQNEADDYDPDFSPDGSRIVFRSERQGGGIYLVSALGGADRLLATKGRHPRFSPDGKWISYITGGRGEPGAKVYVIPSAGGHAQSLESDFKGMDPPVPVVWSPDSKYLLTHGSNPDKNIAQDRRNDWWLFPVGPGGKPGKPVPTGAIASLRQLGIRILEPAGWLANPSRILFTAVSGDSRNIWEAPFSTADHRLTGAPAQLTVAPGTNSSPAFARPAGGPGALYFANISESVNLWSVALDVSKGVAKGDPAPVTRSAADDMWPSVSRDGHGLVFASNRSGMEEAWFRDLATGNELQLTSAADVNPLLQISPDGQTAAYYARENGKVGLFVVSTRGGSPEKRCEDCGSVVWDWSPDGRFLITGRFGERAEMGVLDVASGREVARWKHPQHSLYVARYSPDGAWISFIAWTGADRVREYIAPARSGTAADPSQWIAITEGDTVDEESAWSPDGSMLYFVSERDGFRCVYARRLDPASKRPVSPIMPVLHIHRTRLSMIATGPSPARIALAGNRLIFAMRELHGNIWRRGM